MNHSNVFKRTTEIIQMYGLSGEEAYYKARAEYGQLDLRSPCELCGKMTEDLTVIQYDPDGAVVCRECAEIARRKASKALKEFIGHSVAKYQ